MIDYSDLYDKLVKHYPNVINFIDKDDIISKTKSIEQSYKPKNNKVLDVNSELQYFALVMVSYITKDVKYNKERLNNRIKKLNKLK